MELFIQLIWNILFLEYILNRFQLNLLYISLLSIQFGYCISFFYPYSILNKFIMICSLYLLFFHWSQKIVLKSFEKKLFFLLGIFHNSYFFYFPNQSIFNWISITMSLLLLCRRNEFKWYYNDLLYTFISHLFFLLLSQFEFFKFMSSTLLDCIQMYLIIIFLEFN